METPPSPSSRRRGTPGLDIFKIAGRSISGFLPSLKTGDPHHVHQPFTTQLEERLALYLEYHPQVRSYQRGDAYYREHSTSYRTAQVRKRKSRPVVPTAQPVRIDVERDVGWARYRYLQLTKSEIVERLLQVEQAYAELAKQQAHLQFKWAELELQRVGERRKRKGAGVNESKKY